MTTHAQTTYTPASMPPAARENPTSQYAPPLHVRTGSVTHVRQKTCDTAHCTLARHQNLLLSGARRGRGGAASRVQCAVLSARGVGRKKCFLHNTSKMYITSGLSGCGSRRMRISEINNYEIIKTQIKAQYCNFFLLRSPLLPAAVYRGRTLLTGVLFTNQKHLYENLVFLLN